LLHGLEAGEYVEPNAVTLEEYLDRWLKDCAKLRTSGKTFERYSEIVKTHLVPSLGHHRLAKLQPLHIQEFYAKALVSGRRDGKGGLSARSVLHLHRVLRSALRQAVRWQLMVRNPADAVDPPRAAHREMTVLDAAATARLLIASEGSRLHVPVMLALTTGMRRGEITALTWNDVDLDRALLRVTKSLEQTRDGLTVKTPKTAKGRRTIPLPALAVSALRTHRAQQAKHRLQLGTAYQDRAIVCATDHGAPWPPDVMSKAFQAFLRKHALPRLRFHDLRHTHATQLLRQSVHPKVVAERLGHSTITITLDTYSHVVPGLQEQAARGLDRDLRKALAHARQSS
jgi:integrase